MMLVPVEWVWFLGGLGFGMAILTSFIIFVIYKNLVNS
jgi:hypothetical protein